VTTANERAALSILVAARPVVDRLSLDNDPEDVAADLIEGWTATESALRSLMGGSSLSGQPLVGAVRQRNLITIDQAHALLEFLAARERAGRTEYRPTAGDIAAAREGFAKLEHGMYAAEMGAPSLADTALYRAAPPPAAGLEPAPTRIEPVETPAPRRGLPSWLLLALLLGLLVGGIVAAWYFLGARGGTAAELRRGIEAYNAGRLERAREEFAAAARARPDDPLPHVWLGRVARDQRDDQTAAREFGAAERLGPNNATVHREIGNFHLARGRYDDARQRYVKALQINPNDRAARGWLGCSLLRLGRTAEGTTWMGRAGPGEWTRCATQPGPTGAPGALPPARPSP
jgi:tetratricopeptide (TPR) repeat protein